MKRINLKKTSIKIINKMTFKMYQSYTLALPSDEVERRSINLSVDSYAGFVQDMLEEGYDVLEGNVSHGGCPTSIIVGTVGVNPKLKPDVARFAVKHGIPYSSGQFYFEAVIRPKSSTGRRTLSRLVMET